MRRLAVIAVTAVLAVLSAGVALAAGQPTFHERFSDEGVDTDFCGIGATVEFAGGGRITGWVGETGGDPDQLLKATFNFQFALTNPLNGAAVIDSAAGQDTNVIAAGQETGAHTHRLTAIGLRAKLKLAHGAVLTRDAGSITWEASFNENDELTDIDVIDVNGPHAGFDSSVWCDAAIEALGL